MPPLSTTGMTKFKRYGAKFNLGLLGFLCRVMLKPGHYILTHEPAGASDSLTKITTQLTTCPMLICCCCREIRVFPLDLSPKASEPSALGLCSALPPSIPWFSPIPAIQSILQDSKEHTEGLGGFDLLAD